MTQTESLLAKLSEWKPAGAGRHSLAVSLPETDWAVQLTADKADSLSCLVWELTFTRTGTAPEGFALKDWAESMAKRVTGLLEPLRVLEVDATRGEALLRSDAPAKKGERLAYYEVRLFADSRAVVRRFTGSRAESGREQIAFALTHEVLAKLADDIVG